MIKTLRSIVLSAVAALSLGGCIPEEDPVAPYNRGDIQQNMVGMETDYRYQVYFDLGTNQAVSTVLVTDWDLGFSSADSGVAIWLNPGKIMAAADAGTTDFEAVTSVDGAQWRYDDPTGNPDSTAIGLWWQKTSGVIESRHQVYIIDRGVTPAGKKVGYKKLTILDYTDETYTVRFADLNGVNDVTITVNRDEEHNLMGLLLDKTGSVLATEPPNSTWDIVFTRYTHIFYEPEFTPYSVTGALLNTNSVSVAIDSTHEFGQITADMMEQYSFSEKRDAVGYDWKTFYLDKNEYVVRTNMIYIIRDTEGFYYKLHFTDFYNEEGEKGFPSFEYRKL
jgi:hypothetical protein